MKKQLGISPSLRPLLMHGEQPRRAWRGAADTRGCGRRENRGVMKIQELLTPGDVKALNGKNINGGVRK